MQLICEIANFIRTNRDNNIIDVSICRNYIQVRDSNKFLYVNFDYLEHINIHKWDDSTKIIINELEYNQSLNVYAFYFNVADPNSLQNLLKVYDIVFRVD